VVTDNNSRNVVHTPRKPWDVYFMDLARMVATRSTCPRRHVGAIIVADKRILATGYNGSRKGEAHCDEVGCIIMDGHCKRTIHAERNALYQLIDTYEVARYPELRYLLNHATVYCTYIPCSECMNLLIEWGITHFRYAEGG